MAPSITGTEFWNVNIPESEWTAECPDYLREVDSNDQAQLATPDAEYTLMSWDEVKRLVETQRLELFKRIPSRLHAYRKYIRDITKSHGSVMNFVQKERLGWNDLDPKGGSFHDQGNVKILRNDWPYGLDERIVHLVVWTKPRFEEDPATGRLTIESRKAINDYVENVFAPMKMGDDLLWFHNWTALKSVHAIEHFHVLLYEPDLAVVQRLTGGDVAMSENKR